MEGRYVICSHLRGMERQATQTTLATEDCFICAGPICYTEPAGIYAGVRAHTECYWRGIGFSEWERNA
jgi:hypothetical protein